MAKTKTTIRRKPSEYKAKEVRDEERSKFKALSVKRKPPPKTPNRKGESTANIDNTEPNKTDTNEENDNIDTDNGELLSSTDIQTLGDWNQNGTFSFGNHDPKKVHKIARAAAKDFMINGIVFPDECDIDYHRIEGKEYVKCLKRHYRAEFPQQTILERDIAGFHDRFKVTMMRKFSVVRADIVGRCKKRYFGTCVIASGCIHNMNI